MSRVARLGQPTTRGWEGARGEEGQGGMSRRQAKPSPEVASNKDR